MLFHHNRFTGLIFINIFLLCRSCFSKKTTSDSLLVVQSENGDQNEELIACARYSLQREIQDILQEGTQSKTCVVFLVQLTGLAGNYFSGYQVRRINFYIKVFLYFVIKTSEVLIILYTLNLLLRVVNYCCRINKFTLLKS